MTSLKLHEVLEEEYVAMYGPLQKPDDDTARLDNVEILKDLPYGLGDAAREAVEQWRFRPATYRGEPIDVYYTVTVNFRLQ